MVDPVTGIGLASSLLTIIELGYKISKRIVELSGDLGNLPPDLQSCKDLVEIIVRCAKRLQGKAPQVVGQEAIHGPPTELQADLKVLFDRCYETAKALFELLGSLEGAGAFSRAIKLTRKEGKIFSIRNRLDHHVMAMLLLLGEDQTKSDTEIRYRSLIPPLLTLSIPLW